MDITKDLLFREDYSKGILHDLFFDKLENINVRKMYRMGITTGVTAQKITNHIVLQLKIEYKDIYLNKLLEGKDNSLKDKNGI